MEGSENFVTVFTYQQKYHCKNKNFILLIYYIAGGKQNKFKF